MFAGRFFSIFPKQTCCSLLTRSMSKISFDSITIKRGPKEFRKPAYSPELWGSLKLDYAHEPTRQVAVRNVDASTAEGNVVELYESVFGLPLRRDILHRVVHYQRNKIRQGTSCAKTKSEVSGSGKKPHRQKGTGRARLGTKRAPQTRHGGIAHPPRPRDWSTKLPKKIRQLGLKIAFSARLKEERLHIVDLPSMEAPKTKTVATQLVNWGNDAKILMLVDPDVSENFLMSARNLPNVQLMSVTNANVYDVLANSLVFLTPASVDYLHYRFVVPDFIENTEEEDEE